jgi:hypothetical protein
MRLLIGSLMLVLITGFACAQSASPADEKQLMTLEETFEKALNNNDDASIAVIEKHTIDPFTYIDVFGNVATESVKDLLNGLRHSEPGVTTTQKQSDYKIDVIGKTAVITYKTLFSTSGRKKEALNVTDAPSNCMDVFVKKGKEWYGWSTACAATQSIPQAAYDAIAEEMKK